MGKVETGEPTGHNEGPFLSDIVMAILDDNRLRPVANVKGVLNAISGGDTKDTTTTTRMYEYPLTDSEQKLKARTQRRDQRNASRVIQIVNIRQAINGERSRLTPDMRKVNRRREELNLLMQTQGAWL